MAAPQLVVRVAANLSEMKANMAEGVSQIETYTSALKTASNAYDGSRVVTQANAAAAAIQNAGGVTALTSSEMAKANAIFTQASEKMQLMGQGASFQGQSFAKLAEQTKATTQETSSFEKGLERVGERMAEFFAIREVLNFSKELLESTAALEDLHLATGISTEGIQRLSYVASEYGISQESITRAVETFSSKLATGDASASFAVNKLGLNVRDLIALGPEKAFISFADAASGVADPMDKAAIYTEAFGGRLGRTLIALGDVSQAMKDVPQTAIISDVTIQSAHDFDVVLEHLETNAKALAAESIGGIVSGTTLLSGSLNIFGQAIMAANSALSDHSKALGEHGKDVVLAVSHEQLLANALKELRVDAIAPLTEEQKTNIDALNKGGVALKEIAQLVDSNTMAVKEYIDAKKESTRIEAQTTEAHEKLIAQMKASADAFYATDVERATIAANLKYDTAVTEAKKKKIVDESYYHDLAELRDADVERAKIDGAALSKSSLEQLETTRDKFDATYAAMDASGLNFSLAERTRWGLLRDAAHDAVYGIQIDVGALESHSIEHLQDLYNNAEATFEEMTTSGLHFTRETIDHFRDLRDKALDALHNIKDSAVDAGQAVSDSFGGATKKAAADIKSLATALSAVEPALPPGGSATYDMSTQAGFDRYFRENTAAEITAAGLQAHIAPSWFTNGKTLQDAIELGFIDPYAWWKQHPLGFAEGVQNFGGGMALVGERGPEIVNLPRGSDVIPNHALGAMGGMTVNVYVSGAIVGTQTQLAQLVGEAFMAQQRGSGQRFPVTMQGR